MKKLNPLIILFLISIFMLSCSKDDDPINAGEETPIDYPIPEIPDNNVVAHRGAYKESGLPENSIASLKEAIFLGCYASECDIHITKDKQVVIYHDDTFNGLVFKDATYAELSATGTLSNGERLPLFDDYLNIILSAGKTILFVDVKSVEDINGGDEWAIMAGQEAAKIIHEKKAKNFVRFIVGRESVLKKCIEASKGDWECGYMNYKMSANTFYSRGYTWANFTVDVFYQNESLIQSYQNYGIRVSTYNADTEDQMNWFIGKNIFAICTDYPKKLLELMHKE